MRAPMTTTSRGYGHNHQQQRRDWATRVATGTVTCWECGLLITPTDTWDLGHDYHDRTITRGPQHANCNRAAAGRHKRAPRKTEPHPGMK